ncbi:MAG: ABC transporter ATP-binding protein [Bradymonadales bacterium]|nr:ABC transporter ATP-binding protein [Bradymonadales bacterium]
MSESTSTATVRPESDTVIELERVSKSFGTLKAVDEVSLSIARGSCYALLGPNGAGKTTLTRIIGGVLPRNGGKVWVLGRDPWEEQSEVKARLGVVLQEDALDEDLDVARNLEIYGRFYWITGRRLKEKVHDLLTLVNLDGRERSQIMALSGGMKRRLVIARALLNEPEILLLDEPTTGLDPQVRQLIWSLMRKLMAGGMTILLTTHYMFEAAELADRVGIMDQGKLIAEGAPAQLIETYLPPFVLEFESSQATDLFLAEQAEPLLVERHGDRTLIFHESEQLLLDLVSRLQLSRTGLRGTTLEDVFLKLTGRGLHE